MRFLSLLFFLGALGDGERGFRQMRAEHGLVHRPVHREDTWGISGRYLACDQFDSVVCEG